MAALQTPSDGPDYPVVSHRDLCGLGGRHRISLEGYENHPPQRIHFVDREGRFHLRPFVYGHEKRTNTETYTIEFAARYEQRYPIHRLVAGDAKYRLLGFLPIESNLHLVGVREGYLVLFGTDKFGRDMLSRVLFKGRVSLTVGWVGVMISVILGVVIVSPQGMRPVSPTGLWQRTA